MRLETPQNEKTDSKSNSSTPQFMGVYVEKKIYSKGKSKNIKQYCCGAQTGLNSKDLHRIQTPLL
jgi:hypothetical protein